MRFLTRFVGLAFGALTLFTIFFLAGSSNSSSPHSDPVIKSRTSVIANQIEVSIGKPLVGNQATAAKPLVIDAAERAKYQWFTCDSAVPAATKLPANCAEIQGATGQVIDLASEFVGKHIMYSMSVGSGPVAFSAATEAAVSPAPVLSASPTGLNKSLRFTSAKTPTQNSKISITRGAWPTSATGYTFEYEWLRCTSATTANDIAPEGCTSIDGASASTYTVTGDDVGYRIVSHIKATLDTTVTDVWTGGIGPVYKAIKYYKGAAVAAGAGSYPYLVGTPVNAEEGTWDGPPKFSYQWYSCTAKVAPAATLNKLCKIIAGATSESYTPTLAMNGKYLMVRISGSTPLATTVVTTFSAGSTKVLDDPSNVKVPTLPATAPVVGSSIAVTPGVWSGSPAPVKTYQWYSCLTPELTAGGDAPDDCTAIDGATGTSYTIPQSQYSRFLLVEEQATSIAGTDDIFSATTVAVVSRPVFAADPSISGVAEIGNTFSATDGAGQDSLQDSIEFQWLACTSPSVSASVKPNSCNPIPQATGATFVATRTVENNYLAVQVTLVNSVGRTVRVSATSSDFIRSAPLLADDVFAPAAAPVVGTAVVAPSGTWRGAPAPSFAYQWFVCDSTGPKANDLPSGCAEIQGATSASFTPAHAQTASYLRVRVIGANALGSVTEFSAATSVVKERPNFIGAPVLSSDAVTGTAIQLTETSANGVPVPTRTIAWYQCKGVVANAGSAVPTTGSCTVIPGQNAASYTPTNADLDKYIAAFVTSTNDIGSVSVFTATSGVIRGAPTLVGAIAAPGIAGANPRVSVAITAPNSTWVGSPAPVKTLQWYSCAVENLSTSTDLPDTCAEIPGATAASFTPTVSEVDRFLLVRVTASNSVQTVSRYTATTLVVQEVPNFLVDPTISGGRLQGQDLQVDQLFTRGSPTPSITYSWYRCAAAVTAVLATTTCEKIAGAATSTYRLTSADLDKYISAGVSLSSSLGTVQKITQSTVKIQGAPVLVGSLTAPTSAAVKVDTAITMADTTWTGSPVPTKTYQWFACSTAIASQTDTLPANCQIIASATALKFTPTTAQVEKFLTVRVVATNTIGTVTTYTPTTSVVNEAPSFQGDPTIDDFNMVGNKLTATVPTVRGFPAPVPSFTWYRCTAASGWPSTTVSSTQCAVIPNETASTYTLKNDDLDKFVLAGVTLTNSSGTATRYTPSTASILGLPALSNTLGVPSSSIAGVNAPRIGVVENAPTNAWVGSPKPIVSMQWLRCDDLTPQSSLVVVPCDEIPGATSATYTPTVADKAFGLRVRFTATNTLGTFTIWSGTTQYRTQQAPSFAADPTLNDAIVVDDVVRVNAVSQVAYPTARETYNWYRCTAPVTAAVTTLPTTCTDLFETVSSHTLISQDADNYLLAKVTLTNDAGSTSKFTASTLQIISKPTFSPEPVVTGQNYVGGTLTIDTFSVSAKPKEVLTYQWYYCGIQYRVNFSDVQDGCYVIAGATGTSYRPTKNDVAKYITVVVTATNKAGATSVFSKTSSAILMPPENLVPQVVSGTTVINERLSTDTGTWTPATGVTFEYKWFACTRSIAAAADTISTTDCAQIPSATTANLSLGAAQVGKYIVSAVTAKNWTIPVTKYSASTDIIADYPLYVSGMSVTLPAGEGSTSGAPRVGYKIAAVEGTWSGTPAPSYTYQWFVCPEQRLSGDKTIGVNCLDILNATARELIITPTLASDYQLVGKYLGVRINGTNKAGTDFAYSATSTKTVMMPPQLVTPPEISGYRYVDANLTGTVATFTGTPTPVQRQSWYACSSAIPEPVTTQPAGCAAVPLATNGTLKLTIGMKGQYITTATTSTNDAGVVTVWAKSTVAVTTGAINIVAPTISPNQGTIPKVGTALNANHGTWSGDPALTEASYTYQWYSCIAEVKAASYTLNPLMECIRVGDAVNTSYVPTIEDAGRFILVSVTGTNSNGGSTIFSATTTRVNLAPSNLTVPVIAGNSFVASEQMTSDGTWLAIPLPEYSYQWYVCTTSQTVAPSALPADCAAIDQAISSRYVPVIDQGGKYLMVKVTATNVAGTASVYSLTSPEIKAAPVNLTAPTITIAADTQGLPVANQSTLSTTGGVWAGRPTPTLEFQWYSCVEPITANANDPAAAKDCQPVTERAANISYQPVTADRGRYITVRVYAKNIHGEVTHWSASTSVINMAPIAAASATVTGVAFVQSTVVAKGDTWVSYPDPSRSYQWLYCGEIEIPSACTVVSGASGSTFTIPSTLEGKSIMVKVTASNTFGSDSSYSLASAKVTTGPVSTVAQVISGSVAYPPVNGAVLSANDGTWAGNPRPTLTYQWYRCSAVIASSSTIELDPRCKPIDGATSNTYALTDADPGNSMMIAIKGVNTYGESTRYSASTPIVTEKVRMITAPTLLSKARIGEIITADEGVWRGYPDPTPNTVYAWYTCTTATPSAPVLVPAASGPSVTPPANCTVINGATSKTFLISNGQKDQMLIFMVTKSNTVDGVTTRVSAYTQSSLPAAQPPVSLTKPVVSSPGAATGSNPKVGSVWSVNTNLWADPQPTKTYQWYRCDSLVSTGTTPITTIPADQNCVAITGATGASYTVVAEDSGKYLSIEAIGSNAADTIHQWSNSTQSVLQVPIAITPPTVSGDRQRGKVLTVDPGIWTGSPVPVITYQWYSCTSAIATTSTTPPPANTCSVISGETSSTYTQSLAGTDDGKFVTVTVSGTSGTADPTVYWVKVASGDATALAPSAIQLPSLQLKSGKSAVGEVFDIVNDRWVAAPTPTFTYQWYHCKTPSIRASASLDANCVAIAGETSSNYIATLAQANDSVYPYLMGSVTATNIAGTQTVYTDSWVSVIDKAIVNTKPMTITLTNVNVPTSVAWTPGEWTSSSELRLVHKWLYCDSALSQVYSYIPDGCLIWSTVVENPNAPPPLDVTKDMELSGKYIAMYERVDRKVDATTWSKVRERVTTTTPKLLEVPSLRSGTGFKAPSVDLDMVVGYATTAAPGTWVEALNGETSYTWRGAPAGTFNYQWFSCSSRQSAYNTTGLPAGCDYIPTSANRSTIGNTITPLESEIGSFLGVRITAVNSSGTSTVWTNTSLAVTQEVTNLAPPVLGSAYVVGDRLTLTGGTLASWKGSPTPTVTVEWFSCTAAFPVAPTSLPAGCTAFTNGTALPNEGLTIPLSLSSSTQYVMVRVTGTNKAWVNANKATSLPLYSATSKRIMSKPYINGTSYPGMTGPADVGGTLQLSSGSWLGTPFITLQGRWFACNTAVAASTLENVADGCTLIKSKTQSILLAHAQVGKYIVGQMVATNDAGVTYQSAASSTKVLEPPTIVSPPEVTLVDPPLSSGKNEVGQRLTYNPATWDGSPAPTVTYKFYACQSPNITATDTIPAGCALISGVADNILTLADAQAGSYIIAVSTAINTINQGAQTKVSASVSMGPVYRTPYFDSTAIPTITGTAHVGSTLTLTKAAVKGYETPAVTYNWYICQSAVSTVVSDAVPAGCSVISGAANAGLTVPASAAGKYVLAIQTASATWTSVTATKSTVTTAIVTASPSVVTAPTASGDDYVGGAVNLTVNKGVWTSYPAITDDSKYSISWFQCDASSLGGSAKPASCGATALQTFTANAPQTFTLTSTQAGKYMVARITATANTNLNTADAVSYYTASLGPIRQAPSLPDQPTITGTSSPDVGTVLSMNPTTPKGYPVNTPTYKWFVCPGTAAGVPASVPANCVEQTDFATKAFTIPASAMGSYVLGWVTATNELGTVSKGTVYTAQVKMAPVNGAAPTLSGTAEVAGTITADQGTWSANPSPTYTYQWYSCDASDSTIASGCAAVGGSTSSNTFTPSEAQASKYILVNVTASNTIWAGSRMAVKASTTFGPINMPATVKLTPTISGTAHVDETLTLIAPTGTVLGYPTPTSSYQWFACDTALTTAATSVPNNCALISGFDSKPLVVPSSAAGKYVLAAITATNYATNIKTSLTTAAVTATLVNLTAPALSGDVAVGGAGISASAGTWSGSPAVLPSSDVTYVFYSCPTATWAVSCDVISTANNKVSSISPTAAIQGKYVIARVTATIQVNKSGTGTVTKTTNALGPIETAPTFGPVPTTSGVLHVGSDITASVTGQLGVPTPSVDYHWFYCSSAVSASAASVPAGCVAADPSTDGSATLTLPADAGGKYVVALVTLTNNRGVATATTTATVAVTATPILVTAPVIGGDDIFATGKNVTVTTGTWTTAPSNASKTFAYAWYACPTSNSLISNCAYLGDTTTGSMATSEAMVDKFIVAKVTVTVSVNKPGAGTVSTYSAFSNRIRKSAVFGSTPTVSGYMHIGETVTVSSTGNPTGVPSPTVGYAWYVCTSAVSTTVSVAPAGCVLDSNQTGSTFVIPTSAAGSYVLAIIKASSDADLATVYRSSITSVAVSSPAVLGATAPAITGSTTLGGAGLTASTGTWAWKPSTATAAYSYKWFMCSSTVTFSGGNALPDPSCSQIPNQSAATLPLTTAQLGYKILAQVSVTVATNQPSPSVSTYFTATTGLVMSKPAPGSTPPSIAYTTLTAGSVLSVKSSGSWTGSPTPILSYTWYSCTATTTLAAGAKSAPSTCTALTTTPKDQLTIQSTYKGLKILLQVTGTNDAGFATNISTLLSIP